MTRHLPFIGKLFHVLVIGFCTFGLHHTANAFEGDIITLVRGLSNPVDVFVAGNPENQLYVADQLAGTIIRYTLTFGRTEASSGVVVAGVDPPGSIEAPPGDSGPATEVRLEAPQSIAVDALGNLYLTEGGRLRKVSAVDGKIETVSAGLVNPQGVFVREGNLYVADLAGNQVVQINTATLSVVKSIPVDAPVDVYVNAVNTLYIAHQGGLSRRLDRADSVEFVTDRIGGAGFAAGTRGEFYLPRGRQILKRLEGRPFIEAIYAGDGLVGYSGDKGPATRAKLGNVRSVFLDSHENLYIAEQGDGEGRIRKVESLELVLGTPGDQRISLVAPQRLFELGSGDRVSLELFAHGLAHVGEIELYLDFVPSDVLSMGLSKRAENGDLEFYTAPPRFFITLGGMTEVWRQNPNNPNFANVGGGVGEVNYTVRATTESLVSGDSNLGKAFIDVTDKFNALTQALVVVREIRINGFPVHPEEFDPGYPLILELKGSAFPNVGSIAVSSAKILASNTAWPSDEVPILRLRATAGSGEKDGGSIDPSVNGIRLTLLDPETGAGFAPEDFFPQNALKLYRSTDSEFDENDTEIGSSVLDTLAFGIPVVIPARRADLPKNASPYYIVTARLMHTVEHGRAFTVGFDSELITSVGNISAGTAIGEDRTIRTWQWGDTNADGMVGLVDAILVLRWIVGLDDPPDIRYRIIADANSNGLDVGDAIRILRFAFGDLISLRADKRVQPWQPEAKLLRSSLVPLENSGYSLEVDIAPAEGAVGGDLYLTYDPSVGQVNTFHIEGLSAQAIYAANTETPGRVHIAFTDPHGLSAQSALSLRLQLANGTSSEITRVDLTGRFYDASGPLGPEEIRLSHPIEPPLPSEYNLLQNQPNPFNPSTTIGYELPEAGHMILRVYTATGQLVRTLMNSHVQAGRHEVQWDGLDNSGRRIGSGIYIYRLVVDGGKFAATRRMIHLK
ncbi:MAG: hypothetical protein O2954_00615 [bacterium]|nr:hypothetical protein [bacterium]